MTDSITTTSATEQQPSGLEFPSRDDILDALERLMLVADSDCPVPTNQLSNAIEHAMLVLENAKLLAKFAAPFDIHQYLAASHRIAIVWSVEDVQEVRPDLDADDAWQVLQKVEDNHDCNFGVTWEHLTAAADDLFPQAETDVTTESEVA